MTQLYRHFDSAGKLLYVGISLNHLARLAMHRSVSPWFHRIARVEVEHFSSRVAASCAERDAIANEHPKHNLARPGQLSAPREYVPAKNPRVHNRLFASFLKTLSEPRMYADGAGLYLRVTPSGSKSWIFLFRFEGKRREMGLGSLADVSLAEARTIARQAGALSSAGIDPIQDRQQRRQAAI